MHRFIKLVQHSRETILSKIIDSNVTTINQALKTNRKRRKIHLSSNTFVFVNNLFFVFHRFHHLSIWISQCDTFSPPEPNHPHIAFLGLLKKCFTYPCTAEKIEKLFELKCEVWTFRCIIYICCIVHCVDSVQNDSY